MSERLSAVRDNSNGDEKRCGFFKVPTAGLIRRVRREQHGERDSIEWEV